MARYFNNLVGRSVVISKVRNQCFALFLLPQTAAGLFISNNVVKFINSRRLRLNHK